MGSEKDKAVRCAQLKECMQEVECMQELELGPTPPRRRGGRAADK